VLGGLYARLCYAFLVMFIIHRVSNGLLVLGYYKAILQSIWLLGLLTKQKSIMKIFKPEAARNI